MSQTDKTIVQLEQISKRFGSVVAIEQLDMEIRTGEFVTLLGPSGCGKSSTLRILGGFEKPDTGRVILDGEDVTKLPPNKRKVNMVFQDYALFPHMTVAQNIGFGLELKGLTKRQIAARLEEMLNFLELDSLGGRYPDQLSGGQRQRVALARALALDPALLLLDEPLGALDAKLRVQVQQELKAIQRRTNTTFVFVTHDQDEALTMSDRVVVMNEGRIEQDGTPEELYLHPASRFVAEFIGETNFLTGKVLETTKNNVVLDWFGIKLHGESKHQPPQTNSTVTASLRLETVRLSKSKPATDNAIRGQVVNKLFKGSRVVVDVCIETAQNSILKAYIDADTAGQVGDEPVWLGWDSRSLAILPNTRRQEGVGPTYAIETKRN